MGRNPLNKSLEEKRIKRNESRKRHKAELRKAIAVSEYLSVTCTEQHREALKFIDELKQKYPEKWDFRKTREFRDWKQENAGTRAPIIQPETSSVFNEIPLSQAGTNATSSVPDEIRWQEDLITPEQIPSDVLDKLTDEIQADPVLSQLLDSGVIEDIKFDERLEHELNEIVHF